MHVNAYFHNHERGAVCPARSPFTGPCLAPAGVEIPKSRSQIYLDKLSSFLQHRHEHIEEKNNRLPIK